MSGVTDSKLTELTLKVRGTRTHPRFPNSPAVAATKPASGNAAGIQRPQSPPRVPPWTALYPLCTDFDDKLENRTGVALEQLLASGSGSRAARSRAAGLRKLRQLLRHFSLCQSSLRREVEDGRKTTKILKQRLLGLATAEQRQNRVIERLGTKVGEHDRILRYMLQPR